MLTLSLFLATLAGIMNGSYAFPVRYSKLPQSTLWLIFSIFTFLIAPWVAVFLMNSQIKTILSLLPITDILILSIGGLFFGIGMVLFTFSLRFVGMGVSFLLNISAGTIIGSLLPVILLRPEKLLSLVGIIQIIGLLFFIGGTITAALASLKRDQNLDHNSQFKGKHFIGISLGVLSGLLTSAQGFVYSYTLPSIKQISLLVTQPLLAASTPWIFIFNAAFIPYFLFFLWKNITEKNLSNLSRFTLTEIFYLLIMTIFYFGSIILFSKASTLLGDMGSVIAWPILMIIIILTSNFWGFVQHEWQNAGKLAIRYELCSISCLIIATAILAFDGYLNLR